VISRDLVTRQKAAEGCLYIGTEEPVYLMALTRLPSRDLYRDAVFSCSVPF
jgi:hypothetical protein